MLEIPSRKCGRRFFSAVASALGVLLLVAALRPAGAQEPIQGDPLVRLQSMPRSQTYSFLAPGYELVTDEAGLTTVRMAGFYPSTLPGDPNLPAALYHIALPPLVPLDSVRLQIDVAEQTELSGVYQIAPTGPFLPADDAQPIDAGWGPNEPTIVDGRNTAVYAQNAYYPADLVELAGVAHMRKWRIAEIRFWPVSYNPATGRLRVTTKVTLTLHYDSPTLRGGSLEELQDRLMDDRAAQAFLNFDEAQTWYESMMTDQLGTPEAAPGYAIITTNQIAAVSSALDTFTNLKQALGYSVQVVTEDQYGSLTAPPPDLRADKVRRWLGDHWQSDNLLYVLLIGNPDPFDLEDPGGSVGDMPMKMMNPWDPMNPVDPDPKREGDFYPTDFYFADLYSTDPVNWDWWAEVYVGRIPVYQSDSGWAAALDHILYKTISYETASDTSWRRSALLPAAFLGLGYDGAKLAELMRDDYLKDAGFSTHRLYWHGTLSSSQYSSEEELVDGAVRARWQEQPFGIVTWYGHGNPLGTAIQEEEGGSGLGRVVGSDDAHYLDDSKPALTFQTSCSTGWPEDPNNLGYALLKQGAVGTVSGSRETWGFPDVLPGTDASNMSLAYNYVKYITEGDPSYPTGKALYWVKSTPGWARKNALAYNLYGDPSIRLLRTTFNSLAMGSGASLSLETTNGPVDSQTAAIPEKTPGSSSPPVRANSEKSTDFQARELEAIPGSSAGYDAKILANEPDGIVSMSQAHNCAIRPNGDVDCLGEPWGFTLHWQQVVDQSGPYLQVGVGLNHSCGLKSDGSVHCWGRNDYSLGVDRPGAYVQISANSLHICGLKADGSADCWGNNDAGQATNQAGPFVQVSTGTNFSCGLKENGSVVCWGGDNDSGEVQPRDGPFTQITSGANHNCAIRPDGTLFCWGSNTYGQTDHPAGAFLQVSAGWDHTCGLAENGSVICWGRNDNKQAEDQLDLPCSQVAAGRNHTCGLLFDGSVKCWGLNDQGQAEGQTGPFSQISAGEYHTCGLTPDHNVDCWGKNEDGQTNSQDYNGTFIQVSSGLYHTCGLRSDGTVHCWGREDYDLGMDPAGPYTQISTNYLHICGLQPGGSIDCWGNNDAGQSGHQYGPYVQVSTGMQHTCGLTTDGGADCWGRNSFGQANDRAGPFIQIDAGYFHTCGLKPDGGVDCWGSNHHGQAANQAGPFIQISTGWFHTCGLRSDGSVDCWGKNEYGAAADQPGPYVRISTSFYNSVGLKADGTLDFWGGWMTEADQPAPYGQYQPESTRMSYAAHQFGDGAHYTAIHLADMDGDAVPEVLIGNRDTDSLEIWRYDSHQDTLEEMDAIEFPADIHDIKAADFDGDQDVDVVLGLRGHGLYYAANTGDPGTVGSWTINEIYGQYAWQVLVSDFDRDGKLDISLGVDKGPIRMFYGDGSGGFLEGASVQDPVTEMRFTSGFNAVDLNGDNRVDLIGTDGSFMRAFLNPGNRTAEWLSTGPDDPIALYPCCNPYALQSNLFPSAGDLDGNGAVDQVALLGSPSFSGPVELLLLRGSRFDDSLYWDTTPLDSILYPGWAGHGGVADLDGDGHLDIHIGGWNRLDGLRFYYGDGQGEFEAETIQLDHGVGEFNSFAVADLNGDGAMDIVTNRYTHDQGEYSGFEVLFGTVLPRSSHTYLPFVAR